MRNPWPHALACAAAMLAGCAGVAPAQLRPVAVDRSIELAQPVRWRYGTMLLDWQEHLAAGTYKATLENDDGTWYVGPPACMLQMAVNKDPKIVKPAGGTGSDCGIFVPRDARQAPEIFTIDNGPYDVTVFNDDGTPVLDRVGPHRPPAGHDGSTAKGQVVVPVPAGTTPLQAGVAGGVASAMIAAEYGRYFPLRTQPPAGWLKAAAP